MQYVVSLTTIPSRHGTLSIPLQSILNQNPAPSKVLLNVIKPGPSQVPGGVDLVLVPEDLGPITKVYYTLTDDSIPDSTVVLVCDDDCIKPQGWARRLLQGGLRVGEVVSFATIVAGSYGFAFIKQTLKGFPSFFRELPSSVRKIDDDLLTLYCALSKIRIRKIHRGPVASVAIEIAVAGPRLVSLKGKDSRANLRKQLTSYVKSRFGLFFDLTSEKPRAQTWATYPATFSSNKNGR